LVVEEMVDQEAQAAEAEAVAGQKAGLQLLLQLSRMLLVLLLTHHL
jgi:hypothetical protein